MTLEIYNAANGIPFGTATIGGGEGGKNYDKEIQELQDKIKDIELFKFPNATIIGEPSIDHGQIADFSTENYLMFPFELDVRDKAFEVQFAFTTGDDVTTQQNVLDSRYGIALAIKDGLGLMAVSYNGQSWGSLVSGVMQIQPNTTYYAKLTWNKLQYKTLLSTNGVDYVEDMSFTSATGPFPATIFIGGGSAEALGHTPTPFKGTINLNKAYVYINGQLIWQGMDDAGLATRLDVDLTNIAQPGIEAIQNIVGNPYTKTEIDEQMEEKQDKLIAGPNITIDPDTNVISAEGGEVDAYTKAETDGLLEKKQDVLTPNDPLKIETYVKSNLTNMKYTSNGLSLYRSNESTISSGLGNNYRFYCENSGIAIDISPNKDLTQYTLEELMFANGYIQMPYTFGQIVRGGTGPYSVSYPIIFGKMVGTEFVPIFVPRNSASASSSSSEQYLLKDDNTTIIATASQGTYRSSQTYQRNTVSTSSATANVSAAQLIDSAGTVTIKAVHNTCFSTTNITNSEYISRLREIDTVRIIPVYRRGDAADYVTHIRYIGLYTTTATLTASMPWDAPEEWGPNQLDLSGVTAYNYLDLKTDSSLTVTPEGNLSVNTDAMAFGSELDYDGTNLSLLSSDGGTLSAVEINLEDKQDKLTANAPAKISTYTKTSLSNMQYNTAGTGFYGKSDTVVARVSSGYVAIPRSGNPQDITIDNFFDVGHADIPYSMGQMVAVQTLNSLGKYGSGEEISLGKVVGNKYIPIVTGWTNSTLTVNMSDDISVEYVSTYARLTVSNNRQTYAITPTSMTSGSVSGATRDFYVRMFEQADGSIKVIFFYCIQFTDGSTAYKSASATITDTAGINRLKEITVARVCTTEVRGVSDNPYSKEHFGLYNVNYTSFDGLASRTITPWTSFGENQFDLSSEIPFTYLDVNVDNTTIKVNSEGNLEAQYPAELNGVKLFPTTQVGYEDLAVKDPNTLYVITDGEQTMLADAGNITAEGKAALSGLGMPSNRYTNLELGASGTTYTAPANGWFIIRATATQAYAFMNLYCIDTKMLQIADLTMTEDQCGLHIPVLKGHRVGVWYAYFALSGTEDTFRFIYAEGEQ